MDPVLYCVVQWLTYRAGNLGSNPSSAKNFSFRVCLKLPNQKTINKYVCRWAILNAIVAQTSFILNSKTVCLYL